MEKLLRGIIDYRQNVRPFLQEKLSAMAFRQNPDVILFACADSRVAPNVFASTNPGDLFVIRNIGNMIPPYPKAHQTSEGAAIDFILGNFQVKDIIVCGHSNCGAIACAMQKPVSFPEESWLTHARPSIVKAQNPQKYLKVIPPCESTVVSMINTLQQLEHLKTYPQVQKKLENRSLTLHAWWFDLEQADVLEYDEGLKQFVLIGEKYAHLATQKA